MSCVRSISERAPRRRHADAHHRACADRGVGLGRGTARVEDLTRVTPVGAVLAGGSSRRFAGTPKGLEVVGDRRIIDRVAGTLQAVTPKLLLVANDSDAARWLPGVAVVSDLHP